MTLPSLTSNPARLQNVPRTSVDRLEPEFSADRPSMRAPRGRIDICVIRPLSAVREPAYIRPWTNSSPEGVNLVITEIQSPSGVMCAAIMGTSDESTPLLGYDTFRADRDQVAWARKITRESVVDHPAGEVAVLLASELITNAVVHSASEFVTLAIYGTTEDDLRVCVIDEGRGGLPLLLAGAVDDENGRGVQMMDQLAKRWGVERERGRGMTVWFELDKFPPEAWFDDLTVEDEDGV